MHKKQKIRLGVNALFLVPGDVGGTETFIRETLKAFCAFQENRFEIVLFTNSENDLLLRSDLAPYSSVSFRQLKFKAANRPARIVVEQFWLPWVCRKAQIDLLWSPGYTAPFWAPCPQTVTIPDLQYKSFPEDMGALERAVLDLLVKIACRRSQAVFTISEFSKQEVIKYNFAAHDKIHAVLLGVDQSFGQKFAETEKRELLKDLIPDKSPFLLCVAHSYPHKNINLLIDAVNMVLDDIPHNLVVVGKPRRGEEAVANASQRFRDQSRLIRFSEGLPYNSLQILYQEADLFVLASAYEGFGLPIIEAMMAGVPVITSKEASLKEVGGTHAFYLSDITPSEIARQIKTALQMSKKERLALVTNAKNWAKSFTWERSSLQMTQVFEKLIMAQNLNNISIGCEDK